VEKLIKLLTQHEVGYNQDPEEYYYELRNNYRLRSCSDVIERAAQFITLNRTCFNGLYRVNSNGLFNVPWGNYKNPSICDSSNLRNVSHVLHNCEVTIKAADYKEILLENAKEGDFIYLDPPYSPVSSTAYFTNADSFSKHITVLFHLVIVWLEYLGHLIQNVCKAIGEVSKDHKSS
jgi:DNA adenine methylase